MRGAVVYRTVSHAARCENCPWRGKPIAPGTLSSIIRNRNGNAATHARRNGHRVTVDITREFDRRPKAVLA